MTRRRKRGDGVPPLRNDEVTGMTESKQDAVIRESGTAPDRGDAAQEFLDEQHDQARDTAAPSASGEAPRASGKGGGRHPGLAGREEDTELRKHWDPKEKSR